MIGQASIVDAQGISFSYDTTLLFAGLDLQVARGEIVGLIGPPQSGKTTLLKVLAGLLDPLAGDLRIDGERFAPREAERYAVRRKIGMVFQNNALFDFLSVEDNVAFALRQHGEIPGDRPRTLLNEVGLGDALGRFPSELSGGMKKRASLARATITRPPICFYDEPTAGLDPVTSAKIYALIQRFAKRDGAAALVISNELDTLLPACDRLLMLYQGAIIYSGSPRDVAEATHPAVRQFTSGSNEGPL